MPEIAQVRPCFFKMGQCLESINSTLLHPNLFACWHVSSTLQWSAKHQDTTDWFILPFWTPAFFPFLAAERIAGPATEPATKPVATPLNKFLLVEGTNKLFSVFRFSLISKSFSKSSASGKGNLKKERNYAHKDDFWSMTSTNWLTNFWLQKCKYLTTSSPHSRLGLCSNCMEYCPTRLHSEYILH